jgi:hypothetical protein
MRQRLHVIQHLLLLDTPTARIAEYAKLHWGISRRSTQLYIQRVKKLWAEAAGAEDYLAHLWKSKCQHDELIGKAQSLLLKTDDLKEFANLLRALTPWQKQRDRLMAEIKEHRQETLRDTSPDSEAAKHRRERMMVMPVAEFFERLAHMRNRWRWEWQQEMDWPKVIKQAMEENWKGFGPGERCWICPQPTEPSPFHPYYSEWPPVGREEAKKPGP